MSNTTSGFGWVDEPDGRGTWAILSTCSLTIILCCWSSVCPNVPSRSDGSYRQKLGKIYLFCIGLLGPEFLLVIALGQWSSARKSLKVYGGFLLEGPGSEPFPIDAEQLFQLVEAGYVPFPDLEVEDIKDKSKSDSMARIFASLQATWFVINCIIRAVQNLFLTTLEITTLSFIIIFFSTSYCWYHKPQDISRATILHANTPIEIIRAKYHPRPEEKWYQTPLSFLSRDEWVISRLWRFYIQIVHYLRIPIFTRPKTVPWDYVPSDTFLPLDTIAEFIFAPCVLAFFGIYMIAWDYGFPTPTEKLLWRIAGSYQIFYGLAGSIKCWHANVFILPRYLANVDLTSVEKPPRQPIQWLAWKLRNLHVDRDPDLTVSLRVLIPNVFFAFFMFQPGASFWSRILLG
ncbi:hypothetical protein N7513_005839 [Penicillium frequentans]|nr:hypothetical protein N7513_005839 [Penicillium glabrum]